MWANKDPRYPNIFVIKADNQRLLGLLRTDKNGETYWKFKERMKEEVIVNKENNPKTSPVMDNIQKFQQRQAQTEPINNAYEQSVNTTDNNSEQLN